VSDEAVRTEGSESGAGAVKKPRDVSIDYLRAVVTLMVLAHHSSLAYTTFAHFDRVNVFDSTAPVVDTARWRFLDYAENFNDVFFMSLMFFLSGLFVYPALKRHGVPGFVKERLLRLGLPFAFAVTLLMPIAYYASWKLGGHTQSYPEFWWLLARHGFAVGPPWFIWVLLFFDCIVAAVFPLLRHLQRKIAGFLERLGAHPVSCSIAFTILAALVYLPLLAKYGTAWTNFITAPFAFQTSRILLYGLWFLAGYFIGNAGLERGLLARDGLLVRRRRWWVRWCVVAYNALIFIPMIPAFGRLASLTRGAVESTLWVVSNVASCFAFVALFRGSVSKRRGWMDSLARSAYVMYLVHYVFVTWTQWLLLDVNLFAGIKFLIVFLVVTALSWLTAQAAIRIPGVRNVV
jgi:glucan biosynthesis protein C